MKKLISLLAVLTFLIGCASTPEEKEKQCATMAAVYEAYKATIAAGRTPSEDEVIAAQAAGVFLAINCGYVTPVPTAIKAAAPVVLDDNNVRIVVAP